MQKFMVSSRVSFSTARRLLTNRNIQEFPGPLPLGNKTDRAAMNELLKNPIRPKQPEPEPEPEKPSTSSLASASAPDSNSTSGLKLNTESANHLADGSPDSKDTKPFEYESFPNNTNPVTKEVGGPKGPEPTRYGDWERYGRVSDF